MDEFEAIARLIERAGHPFPVTEARRLVLRATARTPASADLADGIDRLNATLAALAEVIEEIGDGHNHTRHDALADLWAVRGICQSTRRRPSRLDDNGLCL
ncbi:NAD-glutamate dehydrogenase [Aminobacter sp. AP02]|uniref:NAD-glutamate dehydrogenase n=1 Tax=Aminobacter sp. AP02 TaxID=2135737 RepID=UPI0011B21145|nr:NAD-glutamate dehydrogenase [Aminobacter sp. AP02]